MIIVVMADVVMTVVVDGREGRQQLRWMTFLVDDWCGELLSWWKVIKVMTVALDDQWGQYPS